MQDINKKILSLGYDELSAEIISVDAQESYGGGVLVLVTGFMIGKDAIKKKFTQCFFLAPQEKGYFVLNDVFRYVDANGIEGSAHDIGSPVPPDNGNAFLFNLSFLVSFGFPLRCACLQPPFSGRSFCAGDTSFRGNTFGC